MRKFLLFLFVIFCNITSFAANEVSLYVSKEISGKPGDVVTVPVAMKNNFEVVGLQYQLNFPDGFSLQQRVNEDGDLDYDSELTPERKKAKLLLTFTPGISGDVLFMVEPIDGRTAFKGNDGDVVTFKVKIGDNVAPGTYKVKFYKVAFADVNAVSYEQADFMMDLTVYQDYNITATSANETMGTVTGGGNYRNGTKATLTATPNEGYHFVKWSNDVTENPYTFAVDKDYLYGRWSGV